MTRAAPLLAAAAAALLLLAGGAAAHDDALFAAALERLHVTRAMTKLVDLKQCVADFAGFNHLCLVNKEGACPAGEFCAPCSDRLGTCRPCSVERCGAGAFLDAAACAGADDGCRPCAEVPGCQAAVTCTSASNSRCGPLPCIAGKYLDADGQCAACRVCGAGAVAVRPCLANRDTECAVSST